MIMLVEYSRYPPRLGSLAIYTSNLALALTVYDIVADYTDEESFGTVFFESGEEVDWVDLSFRAIRHRSMQ
jgi:hypothetical protein